MATHTHDHKHTLQSLTELILSTDTGDEWPANWLVQQSSDKVIAHLDADISQLETTAAFLFERTDNISEATEVNEALLRQWHTGDAPSLCALACFALDRLTPDLAPDVYQSCLLAALLGSVTNPLPYHNNLHYTKVLLQLLRMIRAHNNLYEATSYELSQNEIAWLMIAACMHDLGHDGTGNTVRGMHTRSRTELHSLAIFTPYVAALGFDTQAEEILDLSAIILGTDVTPVGDPGSPAMQMKAAYRSHVTDEAHKNPLHLDEPLNRLEHDKKLSLMALLLHEADLATSAGLTYEISQFETILIHKEHKLPPARPQHVIAFLKNICQRKFLSDAGQKLYAANLARIYARAQHAMESGNEKLGTEETSAFILNLDSDKGQPKTIN